MNTRLYERYVAIRAEHPEKYARSHAALLGVSEAELVHTLVGHGARRLSGDARALITALGDVGEVKGVTRNDYAVQQQHGAYENISFNTQTGMALNPRRLDLRFFLDHWHTAFFLDENTTKDGDRQSIQFFDEYGVSVHKAFATDKTNMAAWKDLVERYTTDDNPELNLKSEEPEEKVEIADANIIEREWRAMTNVHQFNQILRNHNITRQQAFKAVSSDLACKVENDALTRILHLAVQDQNEIMIFVRNNGCVQIFAGTVDKVMRQDDWIIRMSSDSTLCLKESAIAETWITRKPTNDGILTSLELFAADGTHITQLYGWRQEGNPEQTCWRAQLESLESSREKKT